MTPILEVFTEVDWDDPNIARQKRDERIGELQAQGLVCTTENLYRIDDGRRVFLLMATRPDSVASSLADARLPDSTEPRPVSRDRPQRRADSVPQKRDRPPKYETR